MTKAEHLRKLRLAGEKLEDLHKRIVIQLAEHIRLMDRERALSYEIGIPSAVNDGDYWFYNAVYRVLSFGSTAQAFTILDGSVPDIEALINPIVAAKGFKMPNGTWMDLA